jgi:hypothetical protein
MPVDCFQTARCIPGTRDATAAKNAVNESFGIQIQILDIHGEGTFRFLDKHLGWTPR